MKRRILFASMMCADIENFGNEVRLLENAGIDGFHMDVMDLNYVPNLALGRAEIEWIGENTTLPVDVHLMVAKVDPVVDFFVQRPVDIIYFHPERALDSHGLIEKIKNSGKEAGIVINPDTSIEEVEDLFEKVDRILVMTVYPGFAGQAYLSFVDEKLQQLVKRFQKHGPLLFVDGAISEERVKTLSDWGVDGFILGTSALFGKGDYKKRVSLLRA